MATVYIALGSNQGDSMGLINSSVDILRRHDRIDVEAVSGILRYPALANTTQPDYLNCAAQLRTSLSPDELLAELNRIELHLGRVRTERYSPRTIDLDILLYDSFIINTDDLTIPHPQMHLRSFVMQPLSQLAPDLHHPTITETMTVIQQRLNNQSFMIDKNSPRLISIAGIIGVGKTTLADALAESLICQSIHEAYDTNPYISDVYAGRTDLALKSQLYFLTSRAEQLSPVNLPVNQPVVSDYTFEKDRIFAKRTLDTQQFADYSEQYDHVAANVQNPTLVIYMKDSPQNALNKIHLRNRSYEQNIQESTLADFARDYDSLISEYTTCPVITLDISKFDCRKPDQIAGLVKQIKAYI